MARKLTDKLMKSLTAPARGNRITYDTDIKGFGARVTAAGAKAFIINYRTRGGRQRRLTIGKYPSLSMEAARKKAWKLYAQIKDGKDPMADHEDERDAPTVADLAKRYMSEHAAIKKRSAADDQILLGQWIVPRLGSMKVADVLFEDVERLHRKISERTPIRANRAAALLSKMFALSITWRMRTENPTKGIKHNPENKRDRHLDDDGEEMGRLMNALASHPNTQSSNAIRLLMLTGARRGEVLRATWGEFDLKKGIWIKPRTNTKTVKPHRVPLSAPACQLVAEMKQAAGKSRYLFPGKTIDVPQTDFKNFWKSICTTAELKDFRVHDLRHTYASILFNSGATLPLIGALLGHTQSATTERYAHWFDDPLRKATEKVGQAVAAAGKPKAEVVALRGRTS